jgi:hypothetical protein
LIEPLFGITRYLAQRGGTGAGPPRTGKTVERLVNVGDRVAKTWSRTHAPRVSIEAADDAVSLGMTATVRLILSETRSAAQLPLGVIRFSPGGMIIRNAIIRVERIDEEPQWLAIVVSTLGRTRAVVLTAPAAVLANILLSESVFWPIAITLMGRILVATGLTLLFLPALYAFWFPIRQPESDRSLLRALRRRVS